MSIITAYKCDSTGAIFEHEKDYKSHNRKLAIAEKAIIAKHNATVLRNKKISTIFECKSFDAIEKWLVKNYHQLYPQQKAKLVKISFSNMSSLRHASCSHSAPKGKKSNWCGSNKNIPTTFYGWTGRIDIVFENSPNSFGSHGFSALGVHVGTGGGGYRNDELKEKYPKNYQLSYDVTLWADDFVNILYYDVENFSDINSLKFSNSYTTMMCSVGALLEYESNNKPKRNFKFHKMMRELSQIHPTPFDNERYAISAITVLKHMFGNDFEVAVKTTNNSWGSNINEAVAISSNISLCKTKELALYHKLQGHLPADAEIHSLK